MTSSHDEKTALTELNNRFLTYVNRVRQLKDEEDIKIIYQSINLLEDELRSLKSSYESQISSLRSSLDILTEEKLQLEQEMIARQNNEAHLSDRLSVESLRNSKLIHEIGCLRSDLARSQQEQMQAQLTGKQLRLENSDLIEKCQKLSKQLQERINKSEGYEAQIRDYENSIDSLNQKLEFQDQFFNKKLAEMRSKMQSYLEKLVEMDYKVEDARHKESQWPDVLRQIQSLAEQDYAKSKEEATQFFNDKMSHLQKQLNEEAKTNIQLKSTNEELSNRLLSLRKKESLLESQLDDSRRQNKILEQALSSDKNKAEQTITQLQSKLKQLQDLLVEQGQQKQKPDAEVGNIRAEIDFLRRILAEEELRLNIRHTDTTTSSLDPHQQNGSLHQSQDIITYHNQWLNDAIDMPSHQEQQQYLYENEDNSPEVPNTDHQSSTEQDGENQSQQIYPEPEVYQEYRDYEEHRGDLGEEQEVDLGEDREEEEEEDHGEVEDKIAEVQRSQGEGGGVLGPIMPKSAGSTSGVILTRADSGIGQSPDYLHSMFSAVDCREPTKGDDAATTAVLYEQRSLESPATQVKCSSATSCLKVLEVNKDGKYVKIWNDYHGDSLDVDIGGFMIKQMRYGHPVAMFRFPDRLRLGSNGTVNIWSGCNDPLLHQPPSDFYSAEPYMWGAGAEYTTVLCSPNGQAISWTTPPHRIQPDPYRTLSGAAKAGKHKLLPELSHQSLQSTQTSSDHLLTIEQSPIRLSASAGSRPQFHPFTSSPHKSSVASSIHPCSEHLAPQPAGPRLHQPMHRSNVSNVWTAYFPPPSISKSHSFNNRTAEVLLRSNTEPPSTFQRPQSKFNAGLQQVQSMHNACYQAPMHKRGSYTTSSTNQYATIQY